MAYTIYALFDERSPDAVRYIGFSATPERRVGCHVSEARGSSAQTHKLCWIRRLLSEGANLRWRAIDVVDSQQEAGKREIELISEYRLAGHNLTNGTDGGDASWTVWTPKMTADRSEISRAYWSSAEHREHQRERMETHWASPEARSHREKTSVSTKALWQDPAHAARVHSPEARAKMAAAKLGKPHARQRTAEWNAKIADAQKGKKRRPWTPEERERHMAGMNHEKMSASAKARWHAESNA